jgi:hypothetical protein
MLGTLMEVWTYPVLDIAVILHGTGQAVYIQMVPKIYSHFKKGKKCIKMVMVFTPGTTTVLLPFSLTVLPIT